jgi:hypothetical protein
MEHGQSCEHCKVQIHCRNLYVALKILEEELRFADRADLQHAFNQLKNDMNAMGFHYPSGSDLCTLTRSSLEARAFVARAAGLLRELRRTISISPA